MWAKRSLARAAAPLRMASHVRFASSAERGRPTLLIIRDGWGENHNSAHDKFNAVKLARTPTTDRLVREFPRTEIQTCGLDVGLPVGIMGNSEVGHQNIGAGRIVDQEIVRIDKAFKDRTVLKNPVVKKLFEQGSKGKLHLIGLTSDAGVHAMLDHLYHMLALSKEAHLPEVYIHAIMDGRDTAPSSGLGFVQALEAECARLGVGKIASVTGRYWAMDRDQRWPRVQSAYDVYTGAAAPRKATSAQEAVSAYYKKPEGGMEGDEFIPATAIVGADGRQVATIDDGDAVLFFNFRGDRPRQLTRAFIDDDFPHFKRGPKNRKLDLFFATMTEYQKGLCPNVVFPKPEKMPHIIGQRLADLQIPQFRCAETEKYPHVTFFFNDYREEPFALEDRAAIPSNKDVATYDLAPEMSAAGVRDATIEALRARKYGLLVVNFANPDMVGHTGNLDAAVKACEVVDEYVGQILRVVDEVDGRALVTADHGNADQMWDPEINGPHTQHTLNPVEVLLYGRGVKDFKMRADDSGKLGDISPTLLRMMDLEQPPEMTGNPLIIN